MSHITSVCFESDEDPAYKIWKSKFKNEGKRDFSNWVRNKLIEEAQNENNKDFLKDKLREEYNKKAQCELEITQIQNKLNKIEQIETSHKQIANAYTKEEKPQTYTEEDEREAARKAVSSIKIFFGIKNQEELDRLSLIYAAAKRGNNKTPNEQWINFAIENKLVFVKKLKWLEELNAPSSILPVEIEVEA